MAVILRFLKMRFNVDFLETIQEYQYCNTIMVQYICALSWYFLSLSECSSDLI